MISPISVISFISCIVMVLPVKNCCCVVTIYQYAPSQFLLIKILRLPAIIQIPHTEMDARLTIFQVVWINTLYYKPHISVIG